MGDIIEMTLQCADCLTRLRNDDPAIRHPLDFMEVARGKGWSFAVNTAAQLSNCCGPPKCPTCTAKGK